MMRSTAVLLGLIACQPPPTPPSPQLRALQTNAMIERAFERGFGDIERVVALRSLVNAFAADAELNDALSDGGLDRVTERIALASAPCDAVIDRGAAGNVYASWASECTLPSGVAVVGDVVVGLETQLDALAFTFRVEVDGRPLAGFMERTASPLALSLAVLQDDVIFDTFVDFNRFATLAISIGPVLDGLGEVVTEERLIIGGASLEGFGLGAVGGRVCAASSQFIEVTSPTQAPGGCAIDAAGVAVFFGLECALTEDEAGIERELSAVAASIVPGPVQLAVTQKVGAQDESRALTIDVPALGCR